MKHKETIKKEDTLVSTNNIRNALKEKLFAKGGGISDVLDNLYRSISTRIVGFSVKAEIKNKSFTDFLALAPNTLFDVALENKCEEIIITELNNGVIIISKEVYSSKVKKLVDNLQQAIKELATNATDNNPILPHTPAMHLTESVNNNILNFVNTQIKKYDEKQATFYNEFKNELTKYAF